MTSTAHTQKNEENKKCILHYDATFYPNSIDRDGAVLYVDKRISSASSSWCSFSSTWMFSHSHAISGSCSLCCAVFCKNTSSLTLSLNRYLFADNLNSRRNDGWRRWRLLLLLLLLRKRLKLGNGRCRIRRFKADRFVIEADFDVWPALLLTAA